MFLLGDVTTLFSPRLPEHRNALQFYDVEPLRYDFVFRNATLRTSNALFACTHVLTHERIHAYAHTQACWIYVRVCPYTHVCTRSHSHATRDVYVRVYTMHARMDACTHTRTLQALNMYA